MRGLVRWLMLAVPVVFVISIGGCGDGAKVACEVDSCSGHGSCDDSGGKPVCTCDAGYAGDGCESCAGGFHDEQGICVVDDECLENSCSGHGECDDSSGVAICTCDEGYAGEHCAACDEANGWHWNMAQDACTNDPCDPNPCTDEHKTLCSDGGSGNALCSCEAGYHEVDGVCVTDAWYVDIDATGAGDGSSWANAFNHPQDAVDAASAGEQVWVALGTYTSKSPADPAVPVLAMKDGVEVYGGFEGNEESLSERDIELLSYSALNGGGQGYHVVVGASSARLDGFVVAGGNAQGSDNADQYGGGMYNDDLISLVVENCLFDANTAVRGGGIYNRSSSVEVINCFFRNNNSIGSAATEDGGGGMFNSYCSPSVSSCTFLSNMSDNDGAGMFNNQSSAVISDCTFSENTAGDCGGGLFSINTQLRGGPVVSDCTIQNNSADRGGGMYVFDSSSRVNDCAFIGNSAIQGGGLYGNRSYARIADCSFEFNIADRGGGMYNYIFNTGDSPEVKSCIFRGNLAEGGPGGGMLNYNCSPTVSNCTFTGNRGSYGGGMANEQGAVPTVTNCILWGDFATFDDAEIRNAGAGSSATVTYSDVDQDGYAGSGGNIRQDPLFASGPDGNYYLSQVAAGQGSDSPCVDAGGDTAEILELIDKTTRTDGGPDTGVVDMGYHYEP